MNDLAKLAEEAARVGVNVEDFVEQLRARLEAISSRLIIKRKRRGRSKSEQVPRCSLLEPEGVRVLKITLTDELVSDVGLKPGVDELQLEVVSPGRVKITRSRALGFKLRNEARTGYRIPVVFFPMPEGTRGVLRKTRAIDLDQMKLSPGEIEFNLPGEIRIVEPLREVS